MKRSTLILAAVAIALVAVAIFATEGGDGVLTVPPVSVPGYATDAQLEARRQADFLDAGPPIPHPIDAIVIERDGVTTRLERKGAGDAAKWTLVSPVEAPAVGHLADTVARLFETPTHSVFGAAVPEGDLVTYDLEPEARVRLKLETDDPDASGLNGVDWYIGKTDAQDPAAGGQPEKDTWIMKVDEPGVVYRIGGKDLRTPLEAGLSDLRDKRAFSVEPTDLARVTVRPPRGPAVALEGKREEAPDAPETGGAAPAPKTTWTLVEPADVKGDAAVEALPRSLANLRALRFVPAGEAPEGALGEAPWTVAFTTTGGETTTLKVADGAVDDRVWARIEGRDELMELAVSQADGVRKAVEDLRAKALVPFEADAITALTLSNEGAGGPIVLEKAGDAWQFTSPAVAHPADPGTLLASMARLEALRYAYANEVEAARAALERPDLTASIVAGDRTVTLRTGPKMNDGAYANKRWAVIGDAAAGEPFLIADHVATRLRTTVDALRMKKLFPGRTAEDVARVEVSPPGLPPVVLARPPEGGELTLLAPPEGKKAAATPIRTLVSTAHTLQAKAFHPDKKAADVGLTDARAARVKVVFTDGTEATLRLSDESAGADVYATVDAGPLAGEVFTVNQYQAKNLKKTLDELTE